MRCTPRTLQHKTSIHRTNRFIMGVKQNTHPVLFGFREQATRHRLRTIGHGKHATIRFGFERHTALPKPMNGIFRTPAGKNLAQYVSTPRVISHQNPWLQTMMRHIASTASGNQNFGQNLGRLFNQGNAKSSIQPRRIDRRKKSSSPPTQNQDIDLEVHQSKNSGRNQFIVHTFLVHTNHLFQWNPEPRSPNSRFGP